MPAFERIAAGRDAVAHDDEDDPIRAPHLIRCGHSNGEIQTMPERPGGCLDSWKTIIGMCGKSSSRLAVKIQLGLGNDP